MHTVGPTFKRVHRTEFNDIPLRLQYESVSKETCPQSKKTCPQKTDIDNYIGYTPII